jgi:acetyltransferase-like isoleucine patch superfamily enzyme
MAKQGGVIMGLEEKKYKKIGENVTIYSTVKIITPEEISIGNNVIIDDFAFIYGRGGITIGNFVHIASFTVLSGGGGLTLGDFSSYGAGTKILTGSEDFLGGCLTNPTVPEPYRVATRKPVIIGRHVIIGVNVVILPGVRIGEGCAIGAGSLIKKDCEPWTVYVGSPARAIKARSPEKILELENKLNEDMKGRLDASLLADHLERLGGVEI